MTRTKLHLPAVLLGAALLCSGCVAVAAGAVGGYVVYQKVLPNEIHEAQVSEDVTGVWTRTQEAVSFLTEPGTDMVVTATPRKIEAKVDGADVVVEVDAVDLDRTLIRANLELSVEERIRQLMRL